MATETTRFDTYLKGRLQRDLFFRGLVWTTVPAIASYYGIQFEHLEPLQFMMRTTDAVMRILDIVGSFAIFLAVAALMFKDLENRDCATWGQATKRGYFGGIVRRLAGDLTLWSLGALLTILTVALVAIAFANTSLPVIAILIGFFVVLLTWLSVFCVMNIHVRREEPTPLVSKLTRPYQLILAYGTTLVLIPAVVWVK